MPPILAAFIYLGFVVWLFRRDFREKPNVTGALWLPFFWVFLSGSRFVSQWLAITGINLGGTSVEEGSPLDAACFFVLIAAGLHVLHQRGGSLTEFMRHNQWVTIYLAYCLLAVLWSDYPFVAFKRWIKLFGQPIMVLVILTEPDPMEALIRLFKRLAYVWVPISILFIKYFPELGRGFSYWTGGADNHGIALNKNLLGFDCMLLGVFFFWHFLQVWRLEKGLARRKELMLCLAFFFMIYYLLNLAPSSTSIVCLTLAIGLIWLLGLRFFSARHIGVYLAVAAALYAILQALFGISDYVIVNVLGKDTTLTTRTEIWQYLLKAHVNPIFGSGFESFWLGDDAKKLNTVFTGVVLNEAHNGYLETYLNLGLLGLAITIGFIGATYVKVRQALVCNFNLGRFRFAFLIAILVYNWTEAGFRTHSVPFFMFFLAAIDYPKPQLAVSASSLDTAAPEDNTDKMSFKPA